MERRIKAAYLRVICEDGGPKVGDGADDFIPLLIMRLPEFVVLLLNNQDFHRRLKPECRSPLRHGNGKKLDNATQILSDLPTGTLMERSPLDLALQQFNPMTQTALLMRLMSIQTNQRAKSNIGLEVPWRTRQHCF